MVNELWHNQGSMLQGSPIVSSSEFYLVNWLFITNIFVTGELSYLIKVNAKTK